MKNIPEIAFKQVDLPHKAGFEILALEHFISRSIEGLDHNPFAYHRLKFYALLVLTHGQVTHRVDFESCQLGPGDTLLIAQGQIHAFDPAGEYRGVLLLFTDAFLLKYFSPSSRELLSQLFDSLSGKKQFQAPQIGEQFLQDLHREWNAVPAPYTLDIAASILSNFLLKLTLIQTGQKQRTTSNNHQILHSFQHLVEQNHTSYRDAKRYAEALHVSYKHLNEVCKSLTHKTAKRLIDEYVVLEAKRFLVATPASVKEISYQLGFDEPTNFQKFFKRHVGQTASEFRQSVS